MKRGKALIGTTCYGRDEEGNYSLPAVYAEAVRRAGATPVVLLPGDECGEELLQCLDGLILIGGGDLDPAHYQGRPHSTVYMVDAERDASELALMRRAVAGKWPILCICRGLQVLNVALGGTLIAHLPDVVGRRIAHRVPPRRPNWHSVRLAPGSLLARLTGAAHLRPASWHHQAVGQVAPGLVVSALAPDGTIEALEMPAHPWLLGVQWHPELTASSEPAQQALFDGLVEAALGARKRGDKSCDLKAR